MDLLFWIILAIVIVILLGYLFYAFILPCCLPSISVPFGTSSVPTEQPLKFITVPLINWYKESRVITESEFAQLKSDLSQNRLKFTDETKCWAHISLPGRFESTTVICTNDTFKGVLHSFVRHWDQWNDYVPATMGVLNKCGPIREQLRLVKNANEDAKSGAQNQLNSVLAALKARDSQVYQTVQTALLKAQLLIIDFLCANTKSHQYKADKSDQTSVYFNVKNKQGVDGEMCLIVSEKVFPRIINFNDVRSVRPIITVYFSGR